MAGESAGGFKFADLSLRELLRYGYGGFLAIVFAAIIDPSWTTRQMDRLGPAVVPLTAVVIGVAVYVTFRAFLGDPVLFPIAQWARTCLGDSKNKPTSTYRYMESLGVDASNTRDAFRLIRDSEKFGATHRWERFHREHSEMHILFISFFECLLATIAAAFLSNVCHAACFLIASVLFLLTGIWGDIALDRREFRYLLSESGEDALKQLLRTARYLPNTPVSKPPDSDSSPH